MRRIINRIVSRPISALTAISLLLPNFILTGGCALHASEVAQPAGVRRLPGFERLIMDKDPPGRPYYKMYGDISGDGKLDVVIAGRDGPVVMYSPPDWQKHVILESGVGVYRGVNGQVADMNGNGRMDVVMGGVVWLENPGMADGKWNDEWKVHRVPDSERAHDVVAADLTGNGLADIVARDQSSFGGRTGNEIIIYYQHAPDSWRAETLECPHGEGVATADLDGDGRQDIIIGGLWFRNQGPGKWTRHAYGPEWTHPDANLAVADINGDDRLDVVVAPSELKGQYYRISWFESPTGDRTGPWKEHVIVPDIECVIHSLAMADFNRDGSPDVAYAEMHQGLPPNQVVVMFNFDKGATWRPLVIDTQGSHELIAADFDGDGAPDVIGANHAGDAPVVLWKNLGRDGQAK